jgi:ribosomal protein S18 acetylase RimI-like enzyme
MIREIRPDELNALLALYAQLHPGGEETSPERLMAAWEKMVACTDQHIVVAETEGRLVASCVITVMPNLTHGARSYAVIENVVTDEQHCRQGWATQCLDYAKQIAQREGCYKIMLMTGSKEEGTLRFYEQAGYNRTDKTAFIQWLS